MGKFAKNVLPLALGAGGLYFGFTALQAGWGASSATAFLKTEGVKSSLGLALGFGGAASSVMQGDLIAEGLEFQKEQRKQEMMLAKLAGEQAVVGIDRQRNRIRGMAIAAKAARGVSVYGRSFQEYLTHLDKMRDEDIKNTRINALAGASSGRLELASLSTQQTAAGVGGVTGGMRSLLTAASRLT
jgi:hypothetical protein